MLQPDLYLLGMRLAEPAEAKAGAGAADDEDADKAFVALLLYDVPTGTFTHLGDVCEDEYVTCGAEGVTARD